MLGSQSSVFRFKFAIILVVGIGIYAAVSSSLNLYAQTYNYTVTGVIRQVSGTTMNNIVSQLTDMYTHNNLSASVTFSTNARQRTQTIVVKVESGDGSSNKPKILEYDFSSYLNYPYHIGGINVISVKAIKTQ